MNHTTLSTTIRMGKRIELSLTFSINLQVSMILYEVLRFYPPLTSLYRHTHQETNIGGLSIPVSVDCVLPILLLHNDPKYWGEDVEEFNPERFSDTPKKALATTALIPQKD